MRYLEKLEEAVERKKPTATSETEKAIKAKRQLDAARKKFKKAKPGSTEQNAALTRQQRAVGVYRGRLDRASKLMSHTSYQQLGDILAEVISEDKAEENFRKREATQKIIANMNAKSAAADAKIPKPAPKPGIRTRVANRLDNFSRKQFTKGESDEASGRTWRAGIRGRVAHFVGKLAQRVRPMKEGYQQIGYLIAETMELALQDIHNTTAKNLRKRRRETKRLDRRKPGGRGANRGRRAEDRAEEERT